MSKGRLYALWTILADGVGLYLSYLYGAIIPAWIGAHLPRPLTFIRQGTQAGYQFICLHVPLLPHAWKLNSISNPGWTWLVCALLIRCGAWIHSSSQMRKTNDIGMPFAGEPGGGGTYWKLVNRRLQDYQEALDRWHPPITLKKLNWGYYKRTQPGDPLFVWRGHRLLIAIDLLTADRLSELAPLLARELLTNQSEDATWKSLLTYYQAIPHGFWPQVSGLCILLPAQIIVHLLWPSYWQERIIVADDFAVLLGQGYQQLLLVENALNQERQVAQERSDLAQDEQKLENLLRAFQNQANIEDFRLPNEVYKTLGGFQASKINGLFAEQFNHNNHLRSHSPSQQLAYVQQQITILQQELRDRDATLANQEIQVERPNLEHRRERLIGQLRDEEGLVESLQQRHLQPIVVALNERHTAS